MRFKITPEGLTLNSWKKVSLEPLRTMALQHYVGTHNSIEVEVNAINMEAEAGLILNKVYPKIEQHTMAGTGATQFVLSLDLSCFDDSTGKNESLEELYTATRTKNLVKTVSLFGPILAIIGSCMKKMSNIFDHMFDFTNLSVRHGCGSTVVQHYTAGVFGTAIIIGFSEADIEKKLVTETVRTFS